LIITKDAITLELANGDLKVISNGEERVISKTGKVIADKMNDIEL
jgi:hypothetical protein